MNDHLKFDLNNGSQFPVLGSLERRLHKFIPEEFDYFSQPDNDKNIKEDSKKAEDYERVFSLIETSIMDIESGNIFISLMDERDNYLATNVPGNEQRDYNIKSYNKIVLSKIGRFEHFVLFGAMRKYGEIPNGYLGRFEVIRMMFSHWKKDFRNKDETENMEPMPEYDYKTATQKIAWLYEIGILEIVMNKCKDGETINSMRAANIIHSFTGIDAGTLRKCLGAIYQPGAAQKNNPLLNPANKLFVADMAIKFKLNKENK